MAVKSSIEWTDSTWNPVTGCSKVSAGCKHCYAAREWPRMTKLVQAYAGRDFTDVRTHADRLEQPLRWKKPRRIFVNSMSDLFHPDIHDDFIGMCFRTMARAPQHTFQVLTKRAERMRSLLTHPKMRGYVERVTPQWPLPNVWLGVSVEDQPTADERIPRLLDTPAAVRWISAEPLLGPVDLARVGYQEDQGADIGGWEHCSAIGMWGNALTGEWFSAERTGETFFGVERSFQIGGRLDWVVAGGESGPKARPMHPAWVRSLRDQCAAAGVPFLFKQWGEWVPRSGCYHTFEDGRSCADIDPGATRWASIRLTERGLNGRELANVDGAGDEAYMQLVGKKMAGRLLDGVLHGAYPQAVK